MPFNIQGLPGLDPSVLGQRQGNLGDAVQSGLSGFEQGMNLRDTMRARKFDATLRSEIQTGGYDFRTPEGQASLIKGLSTKGFGPEAMKLAESFPKEQVQPQGRGFQFLQGSDSELDVGDLTTGEVKRIREPSGQKARDTEAKRLVDADKEEWERKYKTKQLAQSGDLSGQKMDIATEKLGLAKQKAEIEADKKVGDRATMKAKADESIALIDKMIGDGVDTPKHKGLSTSIGAKGASYLFGAFSEPVAGSEGANFKVLLDQVRGTAFLQAVQQMKGSGALSDTEGKAATAAIARMSSSQSETEFIKAAEEFRTVIKNRKGIEGAKFDKREGVAPKNDDPLGLF